MTTTSETGYRSHTPGELSAAHAGQSVRLAGWVHRKRDHGGLLFVDLRDHSGIVQCVLSAGTPAFATAERASLESVVQVRGEVVLRGSGNENARLKSGAIEVRVSALELLSSAAPLPFPIGEQSAPEASVGWSTTRFTSGT